MKILIIEDNRPVAQSLKHALSKDYIVDVRYNGRKGIFAALTNEYDFIILDLQLPDTTGLEVCQNLRQEKLSTPILILTGKDMVESKIVLLNSGADDYLTKPFSLAELKARIKSILRRNGGHVYDNKIIIGELSLDLDTKTVVSNNEPLQLSKKEFMLLHYLMTQPNIPISRLKLFEHVWEGPTGFSSNTIDVHIYNIRHKLKSTLSHQRIKTVHGTGYALVSKMPA